MALKRITKSTRVKFKLHYTYSTSIFSFFIFSVLMAITKVHTKKGVAEKFVADLKEAVRHIMTQKDRKLGKMVGFVEI